MADVTVSLATSGKDVVLGAFSEVGAAGQKMGETFGSIAGKLAGLAAGYVSISAAVGAFNAVMDKGGQLADFSDQTGIAAGKLVILGRAFENNGMHAEDLGMVINKMQRTITEAGDEGSAAADKIGRLGLKVSDLQGMSPDQQFETIAKAIANIQDPTERAAAAMEIFGKSGGRMLALFSDFEGSVSQAQSEVGSFAENMETNARAFDSIGDGIAAIGDKLMEFTAGLLGDSVPALQTLVDYFKTVDATEFGKGFAESLARGIDIALSIFTNPGNLFLAFGESLILAFKKAVNALDSGLIYAFEFAVNFFQSLAKDGIISYIGRGLEGAFALAVQGMLNLIASGLEGISGLLPEKWAGPMRNAAASLRADAEAAGHIFENNLAANADGVARAFAEAQSKTELSKYDFMDAEGSSQRLQEYLGIAAQSGAAVREGMQASVDHAKEITAEANAWEKATNMIAGNLSGATKRFKDFASGDSEAAGLSAMSGLTIPSGDSSEVGPVATAADRRAGAASSRSARESFQSGGGGRMLTEGQALANAMKDLLRSEDYMVGSDAAHMQKSSWTQLQPKLAQRAQEAVASDLSYYTGGDSRASREQVLNDLTSKYRNDGVAFGDARAKAEADYQSLVDQKMGGGGTSGSGSSGGGVGSGTDSQKQTPQESLLDKIYGVLKNEIAKALPVQVMS
jgi:hypothetical protein